MFSVVFGLKMESVKDRNMGEVKTVLESLLSTFNQFEKNVKH